MQADPKWGTNKSTTKKKENIWHCGHRTWNWHHLDDDHDYQWTWNERTVRTNEPTDRRTNEQRTDGRYLWRNLKENEQKDINVYVFDFVNIFVFVLFSGHKYSPKQPGQYNIKIEKYFSRLVGVVEILLFVRFSWFSFRKMAIKPFRRVQSLWWILSNIVFRMLLFNAADAGMWPIKNLSRFGQERVQRSRHLFSELSDWKDLRVVSRDGGRDEKQTKKGLRVKIFREYTARKFFMNILI